MEGFVSRRGAYPREEVGAGRPRLRLPADSQEDLLHDVLRIREVRLDRQHIPQSRLLMPKKQLVDMQRVVGVWQESSVITRGLLASR